MAIKIGSLVIDLGLQTANLSAGASKTDRELKNLTKNFQRTGRNIQSAGKKMTATITASFAAAAFTIGKMAKDMANEAKEVRTAAQVAGEGFEDFQRQAAAARTVGIEFDKLGDIFKDVRDRVGDFAATGAGPMADFFEKIGPKVGVTADQFKDLSGRDALQLYFDSLKKANVSQEEMVFYLEAIASDTTALIPLLADGGKAMDELGSKARIISDDEAKELEQYTEAQKKMNDAMRKLTITVVNSGLLETLTSIVESVAGFISRLSEASPEMTRWGLTFAAVAAALGPVLIGIGSMVSLMAPLLAGIMALEEIGPVGRAFHIVGTAVRGLSKALLGLLLNPIILGAAAVIGGIYLAWKNWDKIEPVLRRLHEGVKKWLQDKLGPIMDWVTGKIEQVEGAFAWLWDRVVGNSWIPDLVDDVGAHMSRLQKLMVDPTTSATQSTEELFRELAGNVAGLMDRLFPQVARMRELRKEIGLINQAASIKGKDGNPLIGASLASEARGRLIRETFGKASVSIADVGPLVAANDIGENIKSVSGELGLLADQTQVQTVQIADSFKSMAQDTIGALEGLVNSIKGGGFLDILGGAIDLFLQLGSTGLFGAGLSKNINKPSIPGYANGTSFHPGGLAIVGERGPELVNMGRGAQVFTNSEMRGMAGGNMQIEVVANNDGFGAFVRDQAGRVVASSAPALMAGGAATAHRQAARRQTRRIG